MVLLVLMVLQRLLDRVLGAIVRLVKALQAVVILLQLVGEGVAVQDVAVERRVVMTSVRLQRHLTPAGHQLLVVVLSLVQVRGVRQSATQRSRARRTHGQVPVVAAAALMALVVLLMRRSEVGAALESVLGALGGALLVSVMAARFRFRRLPDILFLLALEPLLSSQVAAVLEHIARVRVQRPEGTFAGFVRGPRNFDEAIVERQTVANGVLPPLLVLPVIWEQIHDELVDLGQGQHLGVAVLDGHGDQADVRVGWLGVGVAPTVSLIGAGALEGRGSRLGGRTATVGGTDSASAVADQSLVLSEVPAVVQVGDTAGGRVDAVEQRVSGRVSVM